MKVSIKDKDKNITRAVNLLGFRLSNVHIEVILNVVEHVNKKGGETTIKDLTEIESLTEDLFKE